jgi:hypothetical protein
MVVGVGSDYRRKPNALPSENYAGSSRYRPPIIKLKVRRRIMSTTLVAFHGDKKIKAKYVKRVKTHQLADAIIQGVKARTRPVVMTALMAAIGLMPAALSTGIGSESQKPLAVSIIGGLVTATVFTLLVFPNFFYWALRNKHQKMEL